MSLTLLLGIRQLLRTYWSDDLAQTVGSSSSMTDQDQVTGILHLYVPHTCTQLIHINTHIHIHTNHNTPIHMHTPHIQKHTLTTYNSLSHSYLLYTCILTFTIYTTYTHTEVHILSHCTHRTYTYTHHKPTT